MDRSSLDGQKTLYVALDTSIRKYISAHKSEFYAGGEEDEDHGEVHQTVSDTLHSRDGSSSTIDGAGGDSTTKPTTQKTKEPLSFIADTVPFSKPLCDFVTTLWDTIVDMLCQMSPTTLVCSFIIFTLFVSNMFTLSSLRKSSSRYIPQRRPLPGTFVQTDSTTAMDSNGEGQHAVAAAVRDALHEYFQQSDGHGLVKKEVTATAIEDRDIPDNEEAREIWSMIQQLERRVQALKSSLQDLD